MRIEFFIDYDKFLKSLTTPFEMADYRETFERQGFIIGQHQGNDWCSSNPTECRKADDHMGCYSDCMKSFKIFRREFKLKRIIENDN